MTAAATRSESALVRPFTSIGSADEPLNKVKLLVNGEEYTPGPLVLGSELLKSAQLTLQLPSAEEVRAAVDESVLALVDCGLVIMATARSHRATRILLQQYLRLANWDTDFAVNRPSTDLVLSDSGGFDITVAVVLLNDLSPAPLRPYMAGTWLARRTFRLTPETSESSFSPEALTADVRKHHNLPEGTMTFVHIDELLDEEDLSNAVRIYLDSEILALLQASPNDSQSIQIQAELALVVTEAVAHQIADELHRSGGQATPGALAGSQPSYRFFEHLASITDSDIATVLERASKNRPLLRATLEAAYGLRNLTARALKEK